MKGQMQNFFKAHRGEVFSASSLAAALGWRRGSGHPKARAARRIARKCGASIVREHGAFTITVPR